MALRRWGIWRCLGCGCELLAKPSARGKRTHDKLHAYAPRDHLRRWVYEAKNDRFLHYHRGKIGLLKAEFTEDFRGEQKVDLEDS